MFEDAYDYEEILVSTAAVGLEKSKVEAYANGQPGAVICVTAAAICCRYDGGTPTAATANQLEPGDCLFLDSIGKLRNFQAIRRDGINAVLAVTYLK